MLRVLLARCRQRHRTMRYPAGPPPELPPRFAGLPRLDGARCPQPVDSGGQAGCRGGLAGDLAPCAAACPVGAIGRGEPPRLDLGACLFCRACEAACPNGAVSFSREHRLAACKREELVLHLPGACPPGAVRGSAASDLASSRGVCAAAVSDALQPAARHREAAGLFRRSFKLRQVCAGGCGACEADTNVLNTVGWDLGRFGIQFVASPRHADGLLITGPVTANMRLALEKTWRAVPEPKVAIAVGACAIAGGPYRGHPETHGGAASTVPVDLFIPGCPPHPLTILDGLLRFLGLIR